MKKELSPKKQMLEAFKERAMNLGLFEEFKSFHLGNRRREDLLSTIENEELKSKFAELLDDAKKQGLYVNIEEKAEEDWNRKKTKVHEITQTILENAELFHDQNGDAYIRVEINNHKTSFPLRSNKFMNWVSKFFWDNKNETLSGEQTKIAINILEAHAIFDGEQKELYNRVAEFNGVFWYDLNDKTGRAVKLTEMGWEIIENPPILFYRYSHQKAQVEPLRSGSVHDLFDFLHIEDEKYKPLVLATLISTLNPSIPHPILLVFGPQGSAKTTFLKLLKSLIDPSALEILSFPKDQSGLIQQLAHHWLTYFDNITRLNQQQSDTLCRTVTGEGFTKRKLYTDDEDKIYHFRRCIGLNGINVATQKPDFLDRSILIELKRLPKNKRKKEQELMEYFNSKKPYLLGAIFDVFCKAMQIRKEISITELPRMADFAEWGEAISIAAGYNKNEFINNYFENIDSQNLESLENSLVGQVLLEFLSDGREWIGTATELLNELQDQADNMKVNSKAKNWPKTPQNLVRQLNELEVNLKDLGIVFEKTRTGNKRIITLCYPEV